MEGGRLEKATEKERPKRATEGEELEKATKWEKLERAIKKFCSNILPCREGTPSTRMPFKLIYNLYFEASLFVIGVAKISELFRPTSIMLL